MGVIRNESATETGVQELVTARPHEQAGAYGRGFERSVVDVEIYGHLVLDIHAENGVACRHADVLSRNWNVMFLGFAKDRLLERGLHPDARSLLLDVSVEFHGVVIDRRIPGEDKYQNH